MPSDKSTVATKADFVPKVVGETDRDRSFSSVLAHDERSQQPRPEVPDRQGARDEPAQQGAGQVQQQQQQQQQQQAAEESQPNV